MNSLSLYSLANVSQLTPSFFLPVYLYFYVSDPQKIKNLCFVSYALPLPAPKYSDRARALYMRLH